MISSTDCNTQLIWHLFCRLCRASDRRLIEPAPIIEVCRKQWGTIIPPARARTSEQAPFYVFTAFIFAYGVTVLHASNPPRSRSGRGRVHRRERRRARSAVTKTAPKELDLGTNSAGENPILSIRGVVPEFMGTEKMRREGEKHIHVMVVDWAYN